MPDDVAATIRTWRSSCGQVEVQFEESSSGFCITGFVVWEAAHILSNLLCRHSSMLNGQRVLELGAGCGLVSAVASSLGAQVLATDRQEVLQRLRQTARLGNSRQRFEVARLDWSADPPWPSGHFGVIVGSDLTYGSHCHEDLLRLLWRLTAGSASIVLLTHGVRSPEQTSLLWHNIREDWSGLVWILDDWEVLERCHSKDPDADLCDKCITFVLGDGPPACDSPLVPAYERFLDWCCRRTLQRPEPDPEILFEGMIGPVFMPAQQCRDV